MNQLADFVSVKDYSVRDVVFEQKPRRRKKDLFDSIIVAFHSACDMRERAVAWRLLITLENLLNLHKNEAGFDHCRELSVLVAGHERLWNLHHD